MSTERFPASIISSTAATAQFGSASGVWSREQQLQAQQQGVWPANPSVVDPYFPYVSILLHGDGTNGAQNNTFTDSSANNFTITRGGNTTQGSFSPYGTLWSNYFDGTGDYLNAGSSANFAFGLGAYTIEFWSNATSLNTNYTYVRNNTTGGFQAYWDTTNGLSLSAVGSASFLTTGTAALSVGVWQHIAICRNSTATNDTRIFVNGVLKATGTDTANWTVSGALTIGADSSGTTPFKGNISNLRILKGTSLYNAAFTPPSSPLSVISNTVLLTCQSNRFIDNSSTGAVLTRNGDTLVSRYSPFATSSPYSTSTIGGCGYFDGNLDYLTAPSNAGFGFGTGDFTIEAWVYLNGSGATNGYIMFDLRNGVSTDVRPSILVNSAGVLNYYTYNANRITGGTLPVAQWTHVAVSRASGSTRMFINGVQTGSTYADATDYGTTGRPVVGNVGDNPGTYNASWLGYISNFRILKGTGLYTTTFTPPSTPLTAITNTTLLLSTINGAIFDNAMQVDLETVGTAQINTSFFKYGTGSIYINGSGNRLVTPPNISSFAFGVGDFTIEAWVYRTVSANGTIFCGQGDGASVAGSSLVCYVGSATSDLYIGGTGYSAASPSPTLNQWAHVAYVRYGTTWKTYLDGVQVGSVAVPATGGVNVGATTYPPAFGATGTNANPITGYIDELRITKGIARYTSNFTPPTAAFNNQ